MVTQPKTNNRKRRKRKQQTKDRDLLDVLLDVILTTISSSSNEIDYVESLLHECLRDRIDTSTPSLGDVVTSKLSKQPGNKLFNMIIKSLRRETVISRLLLLRENMDDDDVFFESILIFQDWTKEQHEHAELFLKTLRRCLHARPDRVERYLAFILRQLQCAKAHLNSNTVDPSYSFLCILRSLISCLEIVALGVSKRQSEILESFRKLDEMTSTSTPSLIQTNDMLRLALNTPSSSCEDEKHDEMSVLDSNGRNALCNQLCTHVFSGNEFVEQHWYHCLTCNLINEKGCCSVCVRVCHQGHDVVYVTVCYSNPTVTQNISNNRYARKSRFFCDCGANSKKNGKTCSAQKPRFGMENEKITAVEDVTFREDTLWKSVKESTLRDDRSSMYVVVFEKFHTIMFRLRQKTITRKNHSKKITRKNHSKKLLDYDENLICASRSNTCARTHALEHNTGTPSYFRNSHHRNRNMQETC